MESVLDKYVEQEINGKPYKFCFPIKEVFAAERELTSKKLLTCIASPPMSLEDNFILFKHALRGGDNDVKSLDAERLWLDAIDQLGFDGVLNVVLNALVKSGVLGRVKKTKAPAKK